MIHYQRMRWPDRPTWAVYDDADYLGTIERTPRGQYHAGQTARDIDREAAYPSRRDAARALRS